MIFVLYAHDNAMPQPLAVKIEHPRWEAVEKHLGSACAHGGTVRLEIVHPEDAYIREICLTAEAGHFRIVALTRDENPKNELLEWWEAGATPFRGMIHIGDDAWDARTVGHDIQLAVQIFRAVYDEKSLALNGLGEFRSEWNPRP